MDLNKKLDELLLYVAQHIKFYRNMEKINRSCEYKSLLDTLSYYPVITKSIIRENMRQFVSDEISEEILRQALNMDKDYFKEYTYQDENNTFIVEYTSGTNGTPFLSIKEINERIVLGKILWKTRQKFSPVTPNDMFRFMHHYPNPYAFPFERIEDDLLRMEKEMKYLSNSKYSWWHIGASEINDYCHFIENNPMIFPSLKVIENNGAYISDDEKEKFGKAFNCSIANNYGSREVWNIAYDCKCGYLHVNESSIIVELVDDEDKRIEEPNIYGNVVLTSLIQKYMPFIRYNIGDVACYIDGLCPCGRKEKRINLLPGRNLIIGTNMYGNQYFRSVVLCIIVAFGIKKFASISVKQIDELTFVVNVKGNQEDKTELEKYFKISAIDILKSDKYNYIFTYDDNLVSKSIFEVKKNS